MNRELVAFAALIAAAALAAPRPVPAQQSRDTIRLREIVITATRLPTPRDQIPNGVTVIRGDDLRSRGVTHLLDALREVPGLAVVQSGSTGGVTSLFLRGGQSNYVRVLVDGVPVNEPGGRINLADLSTDNVDRIEVVRGPVSVLYGSDAVTGVVQVFTRRGAGAPELEAGLRAGRYGTRVGDVTVRGGTARAAYSASASRFTTDGIYAFNNRYRNWAAGGLVRVAPDPRSDAQLAIRHRDGVYRFPTDGAGFPSDSNQFTAARATTVSLEAGRWLAPSLEARLLLGWHDELSRAENAPDGPEETDGFTNATSFRRAGADLRANFHPLKRLVLTIGAVLEDQAFSNRIEFYGGFASADTIDVARTNRAAYAQALAGLGERVSLNAGVRLEHTGRTASRDVFGTHATARAGIVVRAGPATRLTAAAGSAFKEPTFFESYGGGFSTGNPSLTPERSVAFEAGLEQTLAGGLAAVEARYFRQRFRQLIQYTFLVEPGAPNYRNVAGANARGIELEARLVPLAGTVLTGRYTWLRTEVADSGVDGSTFAIGRRLLRRPTHSASVSLDGRFARRLSGGAAVIYVGDRDDLDYRNSDPETFQPARARLPAYVRVDLGGELEVVTSRAGRSGLALTLRLQNALDRRYEEVLYFPAPGRTWHVGGRLSSSLGR